MYKKNKKLRRRQQQQTNDASQGDKEEILKHPPVEQRNSGNAMSLMKWIQKRRRKSRDENLVGLEQQGIGQI
jgi:hypothetical protein